MLYTSIWYILLILGRKDWFMSRNTSIILGGHFANFVDQQVARGLYGSASDVVRAGLRLLEEHEMKVEALRAALVKGENSGPARSLDAEAFLTAKRSGSVE